MMESSEQELNLEQSLPVLAIGESFKCRRCWQTFPTEGLAYKQCPTCGRLNRLGEDEVLITPVQNPRRVPPGRA